MHIDVPPTGGLAPLLPEKWFWIRLNPLPEPYELRAFCLCAIGYTGTGCIRHPRPRAPRRHRCGIRARGVRNGGDGDHPGARSSAAVIKALLDHNPRALECWEAAQ